MRFSRFIALLVVMGLFAAGCSVVPVISAADSSGGLFLPPTLVPTAAPTAVPPTQAAAVVDCQDDLKFIEDITVPDNTVVAAGSSLDKQWKVENSGTCNWDENYSLRLMGGPVMGAQADLELFPARSGTQATIQLTLTAPDEPGTYRSMWQAIGPDGEPFGDPIFIQIIVQ